MRFLELRIPPPAVGLIFAGGMWAMARVSPILNVSSRVRVPVAALLVVVGVAFALAGVRSFRRARTTVNPLKPETTAALVSTGVYSFTRNPMYLGMLLALSAWAVYLSAIWAVLGPLLFAFYITRFQVIPEERQLESLFGVSFTEYKKRVRRWL